MNLDKGQIWMRDLLKSKLCLKLLANQKVRKVNIADNITYNRKTRNKNVFEE